MREPPVLRSGIILVRLQMEESGPGLRARVTYRPDAEGTGEEITFASTVDDLCGILRRRVTEFVEEIPLDPPRDPIRL